MPGNIVIVNGVLEWYVGDSKIDEVIAKLDTVGIKQSPKKASKHMKRSRK